jgi:hypothetical protein
MNYEWFGNVAWGGTIFHFREILEFLHIIPGLRMLSIGEILKLVVLLPRTTPFTTVYKNRVRVGCLLDIPLQFALQSAGQCF